MSEKYSVNVNRLPQLTWNWLRMNDARVDMSGLIPVSAALSSAAVVETDIQDKWDFETSAGAPADSLLEGLQAVPGRIAIRGVNERINLGFSQDFPFACALEFDVKPSARAAIVMDFNGAPSKAMVQTRIKCAPGSVVTLVQLHRISPESVLLNDVGVCAEDDAHVTIVQIVSSGKNVYTGSLVTLKGRNSSFTDSVGYLCGDGTKLDVNVVALHEGEKTKSEIRAYGALRAGSEKLFRGTIDFRYGAVGAYGIETEDSLMLDDTAVNRTVPLILCGEEDVEGIHGATIGRLDESLMFYLNSRGVSAEQVYEMMADARIAAALRAIEDEKLKAEVLEKMGGGEEC